MKRIKILLITLTLILSLILTSCSAYTSSYKAVGLVKMSSGGEISVSFMSLDGRISLTSRRTEQSEGEISYSASVTEGTLDIYYDAYGAKNLLASLHAGESVSGTGGYVESGVKVYIIIEASECRDGAVEVSLNG